MEKEKINEPVKIIEPVKELAVMSLEQQITARSEEVMGMMKLLDNVVSRVNMSRADHTLVAQTLGEIQNLALRGIAAKIE